MSDGANSLTSGGRVPGPDHAGIIAPPPLLYAGGVGLTLLLRWVWSIPIASHPAVVWAGIIVLGAGIALNLLGVYGMRRAKTPINPYQETKTVIASGAFRISRNPIYVGLTLIVVGLTLILDTFWGLIVLVPVLIVMHYGVVLREERYLRAKFGEPYRQYCEAVRRYL
jgi:protein-S-isoprenylcysteine O-methyltransferase Ste14